MFFHVLKKMVSLFVNRPILLLKLPYITHIQLFPMVFCRSNTKLLRIWKFESKISGVSRENPEETVIQI